MSVTIPKFSIKQQFYLDQMLKNKKFLHHSIKTYQDKSLKVLKEGLLRNNTKYKIYALQGIIKHILHLKTTNNKYKLLKFINNLIHVDVMEIICQVMVTLDIKLLRLLFTLLNYMKLSPKFFEFHRLGPITDSLLRTINIIYKQYRNRSITKCGIRLITSILNRENQKYFIQHIFKEESLLNLIKKLYSDEYGKKDAHCYQDILTHTLLLYGKYYDTDNCIDVINIAEASIKSLFRKIKSNSFNENEKLMCISLLCDIINLLLRKYLTNNVTFPIVNVISFQLKFLFYFIIVNKEHRLVPLISQCLLKFYDNLQQNYKNELIDYLTEKGILTFLINEREFFIFKNKINTEKVIKKLLIKQLVMLCNIKFKSIHHIKWDKILNYGFDNLPSDIKYWSSQIKMYNHLEKIQVTIFVFAYFYYTSLPTCYNSKTPHLDQLMITIPSKIVYFTQRMDVIYIKIILFLVAVSMLLNYSDNWKVIKYNIKSLNALKRFADSPKYCEKIYTEHQDFIKWIVSESADELPMKMKYDFIGRWINSEKTNNLVLQLAAEKKRRVALLLLMLLVHCEEKTIVSLYNILQSVLRTQRLLTESDRYLRNIIWSNFILIFNKYKKNESIAFNLIAFIHLAIEDVPTFSECQFSMIISLILTSLSAHKLDNKDELQIAFLRLIMKIISEFNKKSKSTEINIFLSDKNFLDFLKCGLFSDNQNLFNLSINLILLLDVHTKSAVLPEVHIEMNAEDLNLMMRKNVHRALSGVKLFTIGIPSKGLKPLFCISMLSTENVRQIYFNLLNVALTVPDKNEQCYRCLRYILNKHNDNYNLAVLPWTSNLIDYVAKKTNLGLNNIDWLLFLKSWLTALQPAAGLWPTKGLFSHNIITTTVLVVSSELIIASSRLNINEFINIAKLILNLKTRLPNELKIVLEEIASM